MNKLLPINILSILTKIYNKDKVLLSIKRYIESLQLGYKIIVKESSIELLDTIDYDYVTLYTIQLIKNDKGTYDIIEKDNRELIEINALLGHCLS